MLDPKAVPPRRYPPPPVPPIATPPTAAPNPGVTPMANKKKSKQTLYIVLGVIGVVGTIMLSGMAFGVYSLYHGIREAQATAARTEQRRASSSGSNPLPSLERLPKEQRLPEIIRMLGSNRNSDIDAACRRLAEMPRDPKHPEVARALEAVLLKGRASRHEQLGAALSVWSTPETAAVMVRVVGDESQQREARAAAMEVLATMKASSGVDAVAKRLVFRADREAASQALKKFGPIAEKPVLAALQNDDPDVKHHACEVLRVVGTRACVPPLKLTKRHRDTRVRESAGEALLAVYQREKIVEQPDPIGDALDKLTSERGNDSAEGADFLAGVKPDGRQDEVARALEAALRQPDGRARLQVVRALQAWATPETIEAMLRLINDAAVEKPVRVDALEVLAGMGANAKLKPSLLRTSEVAALFLDWQQQERVGAALVKLGPLGQPAVLAALKDKDEHHQEVACGVLKKMGDQKALAELRDAVISRNSRIREVAKEAVAAIRQRSGVSADEIADAVHGLSCPDDHEVEQSARALVKLKSDAPRPEVARALEAVLGREGWGALEAAAQALAVWHTPETVAAMVKLLESKGDNRGQRQRAMEVLAAMQTEETAKALVARLGVDEDRHHALDLLRKMGPIAEKPVIAALKDKDPEVRRHACEVLRVVGTRQCLVPLKALLKDSDAFVRMSAEGAQEEILKKK